MSSLSLPRSAPEWRRLAHQAVAWWLSELAAMMPQAVRRLAASNRVDELVLRFSKDQVTLTAAGRREAGPAVIPLGAGAETSAAWVRQRFPGFKVRILLSDDLLFRCAVELPAAAEANMAQILRHQLERLVPLEPSSLSFVWSIAERLPTRNALTVALTIVKNATLDQTTAYARQLDLSPSMVVITQANGAVGPVWRSAARRGSSRRRLHRGMEVAALVLCMAAYVVLVTRLDTRRDVLREQLGPAQTQLQTVGQLSQQLASMRLTLGSIRARLVGATPLAVLDELTRRLPMDVSASEFTFKPGRVELTGTASHATALLGVVAQSALFDDPQFAAPITAAPQGAGEHFELSVRLRQPKP